MKKFGLIGDPISHSLSPALFRAGYGGRYRYDLIEGSGFEDSFRKFLDGYDGINVTAPYKGLALAKADHAGPECMKTGAANIIVKEEGLLKASNSDYSAVKAILEDVIRRKGSRTALIAGCGGAGKAAAVAAADAGLKTTIVNRTAAKAGEFARSLPEYGFCTAGENDFVETFAANDIVVYTLPAATAQMKYLEDIHFMPGKTILEANYRFPVFKRLHFDFEYIPGEQWLLYQAYLGYEIFTGEKPDLDNMKKALTF